MADKQGNPSSSSADLDSSSDTSEPTEEELDVYSESFNPFKALRQGKNLIERLPFPKTRRLDNLNQYRQIIDASNDPLDFGTNMLDILKKRPLSRKSNKYVNKNQYIEPERRFLPHQMPIKTNTIAYESKNLLDRINSITGPLAQLREFKDKRIRICVKTRNIYGGMNEMVGFVVIFDKHWNLALEDVTETFTRKRKRKVPPNLGVKPENLVSDEELAKRGLVKPVVIERVGKKMEKCRRHVPQLLLRGEHVVLITTAI